MTTTRTAAFGCFLACFGSAHPGLRAQSPYVLDLGAQKSAFEHAPDDVAFFAVGADFDGDGRTDVAFSGDDVQLNRVDRFERRVIRSTHSATGGLAAGDVDGDGDLDLVQTALDLSMRLFLNDGTGRMSETTDRLSRDAFRLGAFVEFGDLDADGDLDLVSSSGAIYFNDRAGYFTEMTLLPGFAFGRPLAVADFDADGDLDIVLMSGLFLNRGDGTFDHDVSSPIANLGYQAAVLPTDIDGDGDVDVVTVGGGLFVNDGTGGFTVEHSRFPAAPMAFADVDGDGLVDLLVSASSTKDRIVVHRNLGNLAFEATPSSEVPTGGASTGWIVPIDLDGDGDQDLVACTHWDDFRSERPRAIYNDGQGNFELATSVANLPLIYDVDSIDVDGDGHLDLIGTQAWWRNDGRGNFVDVPQFMPRLFARRAVHLDVDRDGDPDMVVAGPAPVQLLLNDGSGGYTIAPFAALPSTTATGDLLVFDANGDGIDDLLTLAPSELWLGDGAGSFAQHPVGAAFANTITASAGDIDGDGDLDLVVGRRAVVFSFAAYGVLRNDGAGNFSETAAPQATEVYDVELVDLDNDGDLDLVADEWRLSSVHGTIFHNDGTGHFQRSTVVLPQGPFRVADIDENGYVDIVTGIDRPHVWFADGAGNYAEAPLGVDPRTPDRLSYSALLVFDVDGDGDSDVLHHGASNPGGVGRLTFLYRNRTRELRVPGVTQPGGALRYEISSTTIGAVRAVLPMLSIAPARVDLGDVGLLQLDLSLGMVLPPAFLGPNDRKLDVVLPLPAELAALRGLDLHLQAAILDASGGGRLTAPVVERVLR